MKMYAFLPQIYLTRSIAGGQCSADYNDTPAQRSLQSLGTFLTNFYPEACGGAFDYDWEQGTILQRTDTRSPLFSLTHIQNNLRRTDEYHCLPDSLFISMAALIDMARSPFVLCLDDKEIGNIVACIARKYEDLEMDRVSMQCLNITQSEATFDHHSMFI